MPIKTFKRQVNKTKKDSRYDQWSDAQKMKAVTLYLLVGNLSLVAQETKIPYATLDKWKRSPWWEEAKEEVRRSANLQVGGTLARVREKAVEVVLDRLEHGDLNIDKEGNLTRRPVNAKTASEIAVKTLDRELLLQKLETAPKLQQEQIVDRLKAIEEALIRGAKKLPNPEIIDVEPIKEDTNG